MEVTYYLFGEEAVSTYHEDGAVEAQKRFHDTFRFVEGKNKSWQAIEAVDGWSTWTTIPRDDYFTIAILPFAEIKKIGHGEDTSISFKIWDHRLMVHILGNFYGDTFEVSETSNKESDEFWEEFSDLIEHTLVEMFTEEERRA
jgi:hypothetical protein